MAELQSRFALVNGDDINDIIAAADSENTRKQVKYATKIFKEYLEAKGNSALDVDNLPNSELDELLAKFYASTQ